MDPVSRVRINRVLEIARTLRGAAESETTPESAQRYLAAQQALGAEDTTLDLLVVELKDNNYPEAEAVNPNLESLLPVKPAGDRAKLLAQELADWEKALLKAHEWPKKRGVKPSAVPAFNRAAGTLTLTTGRVVTLEHGERYVVPRLVELGTATGSELKTAHDRPDRILKALVKKYPSLKKHITFPGGPGKGGYSTTIVDESP